jgi:hypothetical protein
MKALATQIPMRTLYAQYLRSGGQLPMEDWMEMNARPVRSKMIPMNMIARSAQEDAALLETLREAGMIPDAPVSAPAPAPVAPRGGDPTRRLKNMDEYEIIRARKNKEAEAARLRWIMRGKK